jgi:hypothetical protein
MIVFLILVIIVTFIGFIKESYELKKTREKKNKKE